MKSALRPMAVVMTVVALSACSDDGGDAAPPESPASSTDGAADDEAAADGVISPVDLPAVPVFRGASRGVIGDVVVDACATGPGEVAASGTATNSARERRDVVVSVSWTVGETGDVVARAVAEVADLAPGDTGEWDVEATVPGRSAAACVPAAYAGRLRD